MGNTDTRACGYFDGTQTCLQKNEGSVTNGLAKETF